MERYHHSGGRLGSISGYYRGLRGEIKRGILEMGGISTEGRIKGGILEVGGVSKE